MEIYLDNSATTKCLDSVIAVMTETMKQDYGNPSSMHKKGMEAEAYIRHAKEVIAKNLKVKEKEIIFTSGGTESDNLAIIGSALANARSGKHIITSSVEHPAVLQTMNYLEEQGFLITYLPVDEYGLICLADLEKELREDTILVSIMHTNNEIGALQPISEAGALIKRCNPKTLFHVDAVQGYGKFRIFPKKDNIDMMSVSSHKIHGPKGVGFLYVNEKVKLKPITFGGGQQSGIRPGTENVTGIAGMAKAIEEIYKNVDEEKESLYELKEFFVSQLQELEEVRVHGCEIRESAPHIVSAAFYGVKSEVLLHALEDKGVYVSAGSACASNKPGISSTLMAIGLDKEGLDSTLRFSFSGFTTKDELAYTIDVLKQLLPQLRRFRKQ